MSNVSSAASARTHSLIEQWKDSLLDLTAENSLVTLPENGMVEFPSLNEAFELLVRRRKTLTFWDFAAQNLDRTVLRETGNVPARPAAWEMIRRLYLQSCSLLQGQDINVLYGGFGVLSWSDKEGRAYRSPLLLVPVSLQPTANGCGFVITRMEEDTEVNPVLRLMLDRAGFADALPRMPEEAYLIPSAYLRNVTEAVEKREGWIVEERGLMGKFPMYKMRLYEDLSAQEERVASHAFVAALAGVPGALEEMPAVRLSPETTDGDESSGEFRLLDADPAQERAIGAASCGHSFVLEGPPGTGKTQTITNIIGECIAANKTVLLVSGRMASLDAVHQRLSDKGLGNLCLLAHSLKTSKRDVLSQLEQSLSAPRTGRPGAARAREFAEWNSVRVSLDEFARELHLKRDPLDVSVYEASGILAESAAAGVPSLAFIFDAPESVSAEQLDRLTDIAARLAANPLMAEVSASIWSGAFTEPERSDLPALVHDTLERGAARTLRVESVGALAAAACGLPVPLSLEEARRLLGITDVLAKTGRGVPRVWLTEEAAAELKVKRDGAFAYAERAARFEAECLSFSEIYHTAPMLALDHDALRRRLQDAHEHILRPTFGPNWRAHVIARHDEIATLLRGLSSHVRLLFDSLAALAGQCGLPMDESGAGRTRILRIVKQAAAISRPALIWFTPGTATRLLAQIGEAESHWATYTRLTEPLFSVYTPAILGLDHDALRQSVGRAAPKGISRLLSTAFTRDMNVLKSVALPNVSLKNRDLDADLTLAETAAETKKWLDANAARLSADYGEHYSGATTSWQSLRDALQKSDTLTGEFPDRRVPTTLIVLMVTGGLPLEGLATRVTTITGQLAQLKTGWDMLMCLTAPETPAALPSPQEALLPLAPWADQQATAMADLYEAFTAVASLRRLPTPEAISVPLDTLIAEIDRAAAMRREQKDTEADLERLRPLSETLSDGTGTADWKALAADLDHVLRLRAFFDDQPLPTTLADRMTAGGSAFPGEIAQARAALKEEADLLETDLNALTALFRPEYLLASGHALSESPYPVAVEWMRTRLGRIAEIESGRRGQSLRDEAHLCGLGSFFDAFAAARLEPEQAASAFRAGFYRLWTAAVCAATPALHEFQGDEHDSLVTKFRKADHRQLDAAADRVREAARARAAKQFPDELKTLKGQLARRRTGEVRKLLAQIPNLLYALKPCVMMNPLSVRLYLDAAAFHFDLVIFDDASQIATEDALGAILRGRQVIIAGDQKQNPPLEIMNSRAAHTAVQSDAGDRHFQSILEAACTVTDEAPERFGQFALNWHYRSHNESLIAFARRYFYPDLVSFPAAHAESAVQYIAAPDATTNFHERVVDALTDYIRRFPGHSAGIITLHESDQAGILDEIARRREAKPDIAWPVADGSEGFFVKTIDNVQGDERDMVILHIASPEQCAALAATGGERLLNVATTRARRQMIVMTAVEPENLDAGVPGMAYFLLHSFLCYARSGSADGIGEGADEQSGAMERAAEDALTHRGHQVRRRVGLTDFRVDLAIVDPAHPDQYLLGVCFDGPAYGASPTARHRDRLCAEMLQERGWNMHQIWSLDWTADPDKQIQRLERALDSLIPVA